MHIQKNAFRRRSNYLHPRLDQNIQLVLTYLGGGVYSVAAKTTPNEYS